MATAMHDKEKAKLKAVAAKNAAKIKLANLDHTGIGLTRRAGKYAVRVNLVGGRDPEKKYPKTIRGVPIVYKTTGRIRKQHVRKTAIGSKSVKRSVVRSTAAHADQQ